MPPRILPHDPEAEQHVLGASLQSDKALDKALDILQPQHFYGRREATVFDAMRDLRARDEGVDVITLMREMDARHAFDNMPAWQGGVESAKAVMVGYLSTLIAQTTRTDNAERHAWIVKEMWGKRLLIEMLTPPMTQVWNGAKPSRVLRDVEEVLMQARAHIEDDGASSVVSSFKASVWLDEFVKNPPDQRAGVGTPFSWLPRHQPGELHVIGGYPKDGKTAISGQFLKAPMLEGKRIGYCTVEMAWEALTLRIASSYGVPYKALQEGYVHDNFKPALNEALGDLARAQVDLIDDAALTASSLARYQRLGRYDFIIIDYLQLMPYTDRLELNAQLAGITRLARQANIPILLLSQFSRPQNATNTNPFPRPTMASFAETSKIEKDASMVMAIWRKRDEEGVPTHEAKFMVLASRYSEPLVRDIHFRADEQRFVEVAYGR